MIDVRAFRESYERMKTNDFVWVPFRANPANAPTKLTSTSALAQIFRKGIVEHYFKQLVPRTPNKTQLSQHANAGVWIMPKETRQVV